MVDVHALGRGGVVLEEVGVLGLGSILADGAGGGPDVPGPRVVLVARPAHLALGRGVGHVAQDAAVEAFRLLRGLQRGMQCKISVSNELNIFWKFVFLPQWLQHCANGCIYT